MTEKLQLSKSDRQKVWWRSTFLQGSWNYERMQNLGWAYSLIPAIKKLYTKKEDQAAALERHMEFFNTTPYVSTLILGISAAMEEARAEANAIIKQHEDALRSVFEQHQIEARRQSETRVRAESVTAKQQLNMAMSKAQLELKREMGKIQTELKTELFEEVQLKLLAFMRTEEYKEVLIRYIEKAAQFASGMAMTIYINPSDADKKTYLEERTGMTLTISKVDFIGGVRAVVPEKNVLVDYAFKGALENEYQKFRFRGGVKGE